MTLTQLEYIVALAKYGNFHKAAKACFVTQPTLSVQVQKLEEFLEVVIFDRAYTPIVATHEGVKIVNQAKVVLAEVETLNNLSKMTSNQTSGEFKIGVIPTITDSLIPLFLPQFSKIFPNVHLKIVELKTSEIIESLNENKIDIGIAALPLLESNLIEDVLYHEPFVGLVPPNHKFSNLKYLDSKILKGESILILNEGNCFRTQVVDFCKLDLNKKNKQDYSFQGGNFQTLINLVEKNVGMTILPQLVASKMKSKALKSMVKEFNKKTPIRNVGFVYKKSFYKLKILKGLKELILSEIPNEFQTIDNNEKLVFPLKKL